MWSNRALKIGPGGVLSCVIYGTWQRNEPPPPPNVDSLKKVPICLCVCLSLFLSPLSPVRLSVSTFVEQLCLPLVFLLAPDILLYLLHLKWCVSTLSVVSMHRVYRSESLKLVKKEREGGEMKLDPEDKIRINKLAAVFGKCAAAAAAAAAAAVATAAATVDRSCRRGWWFVLYPVLCCFAPVGVV